MIEEQAIVVGLDGDQAMLEIVRNKPCGLCGQTRGCGISIWGRLLGHRNNVFRAHNQINASTGDTVVVGVDEKAFLNSSMVVYGVPLMLLLTGAALGGALLPATLNADFRAVVGAAIGLSLGLLWLKAYAAGRGPNARYRPVILRRSEVRIMSQNCARGE